MLWRRRGPASGSEGRRGQRLRRRAVGAKRPTWRQNGSTMWDCAYFILDPLKVQRPQLFALPHQPVLVVLLLRDRATPQADCLQLVTPAQHLAEPSKALFRECSVCEDE